MAGSINYNLLEGIEYDPQYANMFGDCFDEWQPNYNGEGQAEEVWMETSPEIEIDPLFLEAGVSQEPGTQVLAGFEIATPLFDADHIQVPSPFFTPDLPSSRPAADGAQTQMPLYKNRILNEFPSPTLPLKVLDSLQFPFKARVQRELAKALRGCQDKQINTILGLDAEDDKQSIENSPKNKRPTNRTLNQLNNKLYDPLPQAPAAWGEINHDTEHPTFCYTERGELLPEIKLNIQQMFDYLYNHPLHNPEIAGQDGHLTLWIQSVPADSLNRYGNPKASRCRFDCCPDPHRTIRKGDYRVCFDERWSAGNRDPYHNAGYVHLYCLEAMMDLQKLANSGLDIRPDDRKFVEGKNKMAISRDFPCQAEQVIKFLSSPYADPRPEAFYLTTLNCKLTLKHIELESSARQTTRTKRGGNTIDKHLNDLDMYVRNDVLTKKVKKSGESVPESQWLSYAGKVKITHKRKAVNDNDVEANDDNDRMGRQAKRRKTKSPRSTPTPQPGQTSTIVPFGGLISSPTLSPTFSSAPSPVDSLFGF